MKTVIIKKGGRKVPYLKETIHEDGSHKILVAIGKDNWGNIPKEFDAKEVAIDLEDSERDITDKRRFCYVCHKWISPKQEYVRLSHGLFRHDTCSCGSQNWMKSEISDRSEFKPLFEGIDESPVRVAKKKRRERDKKENPCACGCGEICGGNFKPGHDAKLKSRIQKNIKNGNNWEKGLDAISIDYAGSRWDKLISKWLTENK